MENNSIESTIPVFTLSITSVLSGIPAHSIRQYIDKGLIIPFKKKSSRNLFSQVDILRLKFINKLLDEQGLNIAGIRTLLAVIPCWAIRQCSVKERENARLLIVLLTHVGKHLKKEHDVKILIAGSVKFIELLKT